MISKPIIVGALYAASAVRAYEVYITQAEGTNLQQEMLNNNTFFAENLAQDAEWVNAAEEIDWEEEQVNAMGKTYGDELKTTLEVTQQIAGWTGKTCSILGKVHPGFATAGFTLNIFSSLGVEEQTTMDKVHELERKMDMMGESIELGLDTIKNDQKKQACKDGLNGVKKLQKATEYIEQFEEAAQEDKKNILGEALQRCPNSVCFDALIDLLKSIDGEGGSTDWDCDLIELEYEGLNSENLYKGSLPRLQKKMQEYLSIILPGIKTVMAVEKERQLRESDCYKYEPGCMPGNTYINPEWQDKYNDKYYQVRLDDYFNYAMKNVKINSNKLKKRIDMTTARWKALEQKVADELDENRVENLKRFMVQNEYKFSAAQLQKALYSFDISHDYAVFIDTRESQNEMWCPSGNCAFYNNITSPTKGEGYAFVYWSPRNITFPQKCLQDRGSSCGTGLVAACFKTFMKEQPWGSCYGCQEFSDPAWLPVCESCSKWREELYLLSSKLEEASEVYWRSNVNEILSSWICPGHAYYFSQEQNMPAEEASPYFDYFAFANSYRWEWDYDLIDDTETCMNPTWPGGPNALWRESGSWNTTKYQWWWRVRWFGTGDKYVC